MTARTALTITGALAATAALALAATAFSIPVIAAALEEG